MWLSDSFGLVCIAVAVWRIPPFLTQPQRRLLHAHAHPLHIGWLHPDPHAPGLPGGGGGWRARGLCSGWDFTSASEAPPEAETPVCEAHLNEGVCFVGVPRNLRNDLLVAADSITNTMSSLVKELHSGQFKTFPLRHVQHIHERLNHRTNNSRTFWTFLFPQTLKRESLLFSGWRRRWGGGQHEERWGQRWVCAHAPVTVKLPTVSPFFPAEAVWNARSRNCNKLKWPHPCLIVIETICHK